MVAVVLETLDFHLVVQVELILFQETVSQVSKA
jgi:hypothetical protein